MGEKRQHTENNLATSGYRGFCAPLVLVCLPIYRTKHSKYRLKKFETASTNALAVQHSPAFDWSSSATYQDYFGNHGMMGLGGTNLQTYQCMLPKLYQYIDLAKGGRLKHLGLNLFWHFDRLSSFIMGKGVQPSMPFRPMSSHGHGKKPRSMKAKQQSWVMRGLRQLKAPAAAQ